MKRSLTTSGLLPAVLLAMAVPSIAAPFEGSRGPERHMPGLPGLHLAGELAAMEVYIGITAEQEAVWRTYASALVALLDRPEPMGGRLEPWAGNKPGEGRPSPLFAEFLADRAIERSEKAHALKGAVEALRAVLSEDQLARLARAERSLLPPPRRGHEGRGLPGQRPDDNPHAEGRGMPGELPPAEAVE